METNFESNGNNIHPTAIVHPNAKLGKNNEIGPYTIVSENVVIGDNNYLGPLCIIGDKAEHVRFFDKEGKGLIIGNNNRFTKRVTIDCGTEVDTIVGNDTLMLVNAYVAHDAEVGDRTQVRCSALVGGYVKVGKDCIIGLNTIIPNRINVPDKAMFAPCTNVNKKSELKENFIHYGNPSRAIRERD